jgi:ApaG protein
MALFTETTADIVVTVVPVALEDESRPHDGVFAFAYTVTISNNSSDAVQLLERHWLIESADQQIGEVTGAGVVGLQPTLQPGESFEYSSSTVIKDPIGAMKGTYIFKRSSGGGFFTVQIPRFRLIYPSLYN